MYRNQQTDSKSIEYLFRNFYLMLPLKKIYLSISGDYCRGDNSPGENCRGDISPGEYCRGDNSPGVNCQGDNSPRENSRGDYSSRGLFSPEIEKYKKFQ